MPAIRIAAALGGLVILAACTTPQWAVRVPPPDTPVAQGETVALLKRAGLRVVSLGEAGPMPPGVDTHGEATLVERPEVAGADATHLRDTLLAQLQGAALYDPSSKWVLSSTVLHSELRQDHGSVAARFRLRRPDGVVAYERELSSSATWAPARGAVGARWIAREQSAVYQKLAAQLFSDVGFQQALKR